MNNKKWYEVYGTHNGSILLLGKIKSEGNAFIFARVMGESYEDIRIDGKKTTLGTEYRKEPANA